MDEYRRTIRFVGLCVALLNGASLLGTLLPPAGPWWLAALNAAAVAYGLYWWRR